MKTTAIALTCLILLGCPKAGFCWDGIGHELVAQIAYDRLTPAARAQVDQLTATLNKDSLTIQLDPQDLPVNQIDIATWPDEIKSLGQETRPFSPWHYIDLDPLPPVKFDPQSNGLPALPVADSVEIAAVKAYVNPSSDVVEQIANQSTVLESATATTADRARALAFVEHFVGDVHQPLHCIGRQLGGNQYVIDLDAPGRHYTNLHSFWDSAYRYHVVGGQITLDPSMPTSQNAGPDTGSIKAWADEIVKDYLTTDPALLSQKDPAGWAVESNELATSFAFPADNAEQLSDAYVQEASDIARERIALAGIRLANLLNTLFSK